MFLFPIGFTDSAFQQVSVNGSFEMSFPNRYPHLKNPFNPFNPFNFFNAKQKINHQRKHLKLLPLGKKNPDPFVGFESFSF